MLGHLFTDHPRDAGESYLEHQRFALGVGLRLMAAGLAAVIHAVIPCLFTHTAGDTIRRLNVTLRDRRRPEPQPARASA